MKSRDAVRIERLLRKIRELDREELVALCLFTTWALDNHPARTGDEDAIPFPFPEDHSTEVDAILDVAEQVNRRISEACHREEMEAN